MHVVAVIPLRFASSRFPGKPLVGLLGKPLMQWVHEAACGAALVDRVIVATDDERIASCARGFGAEVMSTSERPRNGTERVAELMSRLNGDVWINIQGDEPLLTGADLDAVVTALVDGDCDAATLACPLPPELLADANAVKVVLSRRAEALYFSRAPIPFERNVGHVAPLLHAGVYAFRRATLERYASREPSPLEQAESLEQLRLLEHGERMRVAVRPGTLVGVNVPADCAAAEALLAQR
jgi:3-deoxy-D-manno-octulosonate cytidylyltransferase